MSYPTRQEPTIGPLLAQWRRTRRMSQMELSGESGVSTRHLSFVESGRARPSRELVLRLSAALAVPRRDRNELLLAAGFAPAYRETPIDAPEMADVVQALTMILEHHAPFPGVALDSRWDVLMANAPYIASVAACGPDAIGGPPPPALVLLDRPRPNLLRLLCHPDGLRHQLDNWQEVALAVLGRVRREVARDGDPTRRRLLAEALAYPGVPPLPALDAAGAPDLIVPAVLRTPAGPLRFVSTIATLGTAQDITLQDLRIETLHPADAATDRLVRGSVA
ncbi:helix-turn-helix protein [Stella humosa]|uniref:Helix-turn-helix protein n=1 Tax=Stella humosa TaxID=94 RepID=A0A3N1LIV0_9PROT|nr:helix-turn-helix transcriptional regulator [Stella humosa]ROP90758.1 helix-turn-helix protein [Stella humosa]BBK34896.1 transcriptional regulator [Stella humosa]